MILFIDDEPHRMESYILELEISGYEILCESNVDKAWAYFQRNRGQVELCIIDLMMPPGSIFRNTYTRGGTGTGISFYKKIREISPDCPIIFLTNSSDASVFEEFEQEKRCLYLRKRDYLPYELVDVISEFIES